jgi:hypothetical protein
MILNQNLDTCSSWSIIELADFQENAITHSPIEAKYIVASKVTKEGVSVKIFMMRLFVVQAVYNPLDIYWTTMALFYMLRNRENTRKTNAYPYVMTSFKRLLKE